MRLANATPERLRELIALNLAALQAILTWNVENRVEVFRVSSDTIPFGSHPVNTLPWWDEFAPQFADIGTLMREGEMQISTHPGQYTVLGSPRPEVAAAALADLEYHARLLRAFGLDATHKIVIHVGGAYGDPIASLARFEATFARLSDDARARLVLENDERWAFDDVLAFAQRLGVSVVFDAFHHRLRPSAQPLTAREAILAAAETWSSRQEVHFSTQDPGKRPGAHSQTLDREAFVAFADEAGDLEIDCVIEVKDKEQSVLAARELLIDAAA